MKLVSQWFLFALWIIPLWLFASPINFIRVSWWHASGGGQCSFISIPRYCLLGFPGSASGKEPASAGDRRDWGLIPGLGRSPGGGNGNPLQYSIFHAWRIPQTEAPGRLQSMVSQRVGYDVARVQALPSRVRFNGMRTGKEEGRREGRKEPAFFECG